MSRKGWLLFIALCVIWGIPYLLIRVAVRELPPPALVFLRTAPAALLLVPLALHRGEVRPLLARWRWVVVYTVIELAVPWLLLSHAEERISSSLAGLLVATVPLMAAVLSLAVGTGEHFDARRVTGLVIGFAGVAALVGIDTSGSDPLAVAEMFVVALCYAGGPLIISRRLAGLPTLGVIAASLALTAVFYAPAGLLTMPASLSVETVGADRHAGARLHRPGLPPLLRADPRSGAVTRHRDHVRQPARRGPPRRRHPQRTADAGHRRRHAPHPSRLGAGDCVHAQASGPDAGRA